jgi:hypothetical protein
MGEKEWWVTSANRVTPPWDQEHGHEKHQGLGKMKKQPSHHKRKEQKGEKEWWTTCSTISHHNTSHGAKNRKKKPA